ncbi:MAG: hypothetical protein GXO98_01900 [Nitrospirae bacterium]|nr:hypothetical protein [Nitrospirota bacterium]
MDERKVLLRMVQTLSTDLQNIQQRGAGYYSVSPFVERYNLLLEKAKQIFKEETILLSTFSPVGDISSVDPSDKMKVTQKVLIEIGQLIAYIESCLEG